LYTPLLWTFHQLKNAAFLREHLCKKNWLDVSCFINYKSLSNHYIWKSNNQKSFRKYWHTISEILAHNFGNIGTQFRKYWHTILEIKNPVEKKSFWWKVSGIFLRLSLQILKESNLSQRQKKRDYYFKNRVMRYIYIYTYLGVISL